MKTKKLMLGVMVGLHMTAAWSQTSMLMEAKQIKQEGVDTARSKETGMTTCGVATKADIKSVLDLTEMSIVGIDAPDEETIRIATVGVLRETRDIVYRVSYDTYERLRRHGKPLTLVGITELDRRSQREKSSLELLFDEKWRCVSSPGLKASELAREYPTLFAEGAESVTRDGLRWGYERLLGGYYYCGDADAGTRLTPVDHPTRVDKYAKWERIHIADNKAMMNVMIYPDEPTDERPRANLYGYDVKTYNWKHDKISEGRIEFPFAKGYSTNLPIETTDGERWGTILLFRTENGRKSPTDTIEMRRDMIVVPYDGSAPYASSSYEFRKYESGEEKLHGAYMIDGEVYIMYSSYSRGGERGSKERIEKIGFMKIGRDGRSQDIAAVSGRNAIGGIVTRQGEDDEEASENKKAATQNQLTGYPDISWDDELSISRVEETESKIYFIGNKREKVALAAGTSKPEGYETEYRYTDLVVIEADRASKRIENISVVNEGASESPREMEVVRLGGDNIDIVSVRLSDGEGCGMTKTCDDRERLTDGHGLKGRAHVNKVRGGRVIDSQRLPNKCMPNMSTVSLEDGHSYVVTYKTVTRKMRCGFEDRLSAEEVGRMQGFRRGCEMEVRDIEFELVQIE